MRKVRQIDVGGKPTGIAMLDAVLGEVKELGLADERRVREELLARVKVYNYVPKAAEEAYTAALLEEYRKNGSA